MSRRLSLLLSQFAHVDALLRHELTRLPTRLGFDSNMHPHNLITALNRDHQGIQITLRRRCYLKITLSRNHPLSKNHHLLLLTISHAPPTFCHLQIILLVSLFMTIHVVINTSLSHLRIFPRQHYAHLPSTFISTSPATKLIAAGTTCLIGALLNSPCIQSCASISTSPT
jgi:hypothetical protein